MVAFVSQLISDPSDLQGLSITLGLAVLGCCGLAGISAAWLRLWVPTSAFRASTRLRNVTVVMLAAGVAGMICWVAIRSMTPEHYFPDQRLFDAIIVACGGRLIWWTLGAEIGRAPR